MVAAAASDIIHTHRGQTVTDHTAKSLLGAGTDAAPPVSQLLYPPTYLQVLASGEAALGGGVRGEEGGHVQQGVSRRLAWPCVCCTRHACDKQHSEKTCVEHGQTLPWSVSENLKLLMLVVTVVSSVDVGLQST